MDALLPVVGDPVPPGDEALASTSAGSVSPSSAARRARSSSSVAAYSDCSVSDTYDQVGTSGAPA